MTSLRSSVVAVLLVTAVCAVVAGFAVGDEGVYGALLGGVVVGLFAVSSPLVLGPFTKVSPEMSMVIALVFFFAKMILLLALFFVLVESDALSEKVDERALGLTVMATTIAWTGLRIRAARRSREPLYDLRADNDGHPDSLKGQ